MATTSEVAHSLEKCFLVGFFCTRLSGLYTSELCYSAWVAFTIWAFYLFGLSSAGDSTIIVRLYTVSLSPTGSHLHE